MFADIMNRLFADPEDRAAMAPADARVALAALMVRIAKADDLYDSGERQAILRAVAERHVLGPSEAEAVLEEAEKVEEGAPDTVRFTRVLKNAVPYEERIGVIEALWSIVLEDGERHAEEDALMRQLAPLLGVSDKDSGLARRNAQRDAG